MQNRPIFAPTQIQTLLLMRQCENNVFSQMPLELICEISGYGQKANQLDFDLALHHVAHGKLNELKALLLAKPFLVLYKNGTAFTPAGLTIKNTTLLECAIGAGDPEMIEFIKPLFSQFNNGEAEKERQLERYRPCIEAMKTHQPDDLNWLMQIIIESSLEDVRKELATGDAYDWAHSSKLRNALNQFRFAKLNSQTRVIIEPRMHCNYQNLMHAYYLLSREWHNLIVANHFDKHHLVSKQLIGFIQLVELPAYERLRFIQGPVLNSTSGKETERSVNYKQDDSAFPSFVDMLVASHSGVGFDSFMSLFGLGCANEICDAKRSNMSYRTYIEQKTQTCKTYTATANSSMVGDFNFSI